MISEETTSAQREIIKNMLRLYRHEESEIVQEVPVLVEDLSKMPHYSINLNIFHARNKVAYYEKKPSGWENNISIRKSLSIVPGEYCIRAKKYGCCPSKDIFFSVKEDEPSNTINITLKPWKYFISGKTVDLKGEAIDWHKLYDMLESYTRKKNKSKKPFSVRWIRRYRNITPLIEVVPEVGIEDWALSPKVYFECLLFRTDILGKAGNFIIPVFNNVPHTVYLRNRRFQFFPKEYPSPIKHVCPNGPKIEFQVDPEVAKSFHKEKKTQVKKIEISHNTGIRGMLQDPKDKESFSFEEYTCYLWRSCANEAEREWVQIKSGGEFFIPCLPSNDQCFAILMPDRGFVTSKGIDVKFDKITDIGELTLRKTPVVLGAAKSEPLRLLLKTRIGVFEIDKSRLTRGGGFLRQVTELNLKQTKYSLCLYPGTFLITASLEGFPSISYELKLNDGSVCKNINFDFKPGIKVLVEIEIDKFNVGKFGVNRLYGEILNSSGVILEQFNHYYFYSGRATYGKEIYLMPGPYTLRLRNDTGEFQEESFTIEKLLTPQIIRYRIDEF